MADLNEKPARPTPDECLGATEFFDIEHPAVGAYLEKNLPNWRELPPTERAVRIYYLVRDGWRYNPYVVKSDRAAFTASYLMDKKQSYCIPKALLVGALARYTGIPARLGFGDVKNHISSQRLIEYLKSDVFCFHGFTELFLEGRWVRCTPAFDAALCEKFDVPPLEFDGVNDSLFQEFDNGGRKFMDYVRYHGVFADLPYEWLVAGFRREYPHLTRMHGPESGAGRPDAGHRLLPEGDLALEAPSRS